MTFNRIGPVDAFGVPVRVLKLSDEFYGALGRVAALAALVELRLSNVVVLWGGDPQDEGKPASHLSKRFAQIANARVEADRELPDGLVRAVNAAAAAMRERNELLHSMWPAETSGWRNRPGGTVSTRYAGIDDVGEVIGRLIAAIDGLGPYLRSPID